MLRLEPRPVDKLIARALPQEDICRPVRTLHDDSGNLLDAHTGAEKHGGSQTPGCGGKAGGVPFESMRPGISIRSP